MHLADRMLLPPPYAARPYRGATDHPTIVKILTAYREHIGSPELPTVDQIDLAYANLRDCDPNTDIAIIEHASEPVAYSRVFWEDLDGGGRDCIWIVPTRPDHLTQSLFATLVAAQETHMRPWADAVESARFRGHASHPGPGLPPVGEAEWLEALGYAATEWSASLVRPHLEDIPDRSLPDGVELRPVTPEQIRPIFEAHMEAFRGEWDFREPTDEDFRQMSEHPFRDESLWKIAWAGDTVVGQVKTYINTEENLERGSRRGYTEHISTHRAWRNRGIAGALLAMSLHELKDRGMTEAALGVDTNNPGGAFQLYTGLGFELQSYEVAYTKVIR